MAPPDAALREILALANYAAGPVANDVFLLVADYLMEGRALPGDPDYRAALALLRQLRPAVSAAAKARLATRLYGRVHGRIDLLLLLLDEPEPLWAPLLGALRLDPPDWLALAERAPRQARARLAERLRAAAGRSAPDAGGERAVFPPHRPVDAVIRAHGAQAGRRGVALRREVAPGLAPRIGDARGLEAALLRLGEAACAAARAGETLRLGVHPAGGGGLAYTLTRPPGLSPGRSGGLRSAEGLAMRAGAALVATAGRLVLYLNPPLALPPRLVAGTAAGRGGPKQ
ncbi:hypothetical protein [Pedomonas sp. V897]|uniref:hypothetical protein n=1 Tax=Pedomonas sp. V897 TaxID=3446482 RepID=UPI003EDF1148